MLLDELEKKILTKSQDANTVMAQGTIQILSNQVNVGRDTYEEREEDTILQEFRANAAKQGDLSPMHNGCNKKHHTRKSSWDDKLNDEAIGRRLPMRASKQKQATPTTSTTSNRSKKKS